MAKALMIQGTMSNVGKSLITAGLCRILKQDGFRVAPFKSQNMALNSYITKEGLEMGRAQVVQAEAAGIEPSVLMNPILLKPTTDMGSQVIVNGVVQGNMKAMDYFRKKKEYIPVIKEAYETLASRNDIIVLEGAGSPAEINLKQDDIVNMGMADIADAKVLLVGDIDRGGVFAQLIGTLDLLEPDERDRIRGLIINKFRGDVKILQPGLDMIYERCHKKILGVVPFMDIDVEEEDSQGLSIHRMNRNAKIDIAVIRLPRISNFTDLQALTLEEAVSVRYVSSSSDFGNPDLVIIPGTKNTMADLKWLRENGLEGRLARYVEKGGILFGICGGYQMLGERITDTCGAEGNGSMNGLGFLPVCTVFGREKKRTQTTGTVRITEGILKPLSGTKVQGYEIHMGQTEMTGQTACRHFLDLEGGPDGASFNHVFGTYLHGIFGSDEFRTKLVRLLCERKGISYGGKTAVSYRDYKEGQYDKLAEQLRESLDMNAICEILEED